MLSKSSFKLFLSCPSYLWFHLHKPEVLSSLGLNDFEQMLANQGKVVEQAFYQSLQGLQVITAKGQDDVAETKQKMSKVGSYIAQAAFMSDNFFAQSDLVDFKGDDHIDIYEIKSSSSMQNMGEENTKQAPSKAEHITDLTFQYIVAKLSGYHVDTTYLVELNKQFVRNGDMDLRSLFNVTDVTAEVIKQIPIVRDQMQVAIYQSINEVPPTTCNCKYLPRKKQCPAFSYLHPELIAYGVYDLAYIGRSPKRLKDFVDAGVFKLEDIPASTTLLDSYRDQVVTWKSQEEIVLGDQILQILNRLEYPLYFLDYETTSNAIPLFDGIRPYQHIPFQYSIHIIQQEGGEVMHCEYLHQDRSGPMSEISQHLREDIGDQGTIIVWNKTFETKCNQNLAEIVLVRAAFLLSLNQRMFDLMEIFSKHLYVHKDFKGSYSIKKVLPVLVPELSYANLSICDGGTATTQWAKMVFETTDEVERKVIQQDLLAYCRLDTLAMVEIYKKVIGLLS